MAAKRKNVNNRHRYKCINVDHDTYQIIYRLARSHRRSLLEQVKAMADAERKKLAESSMFPELDERKND
jgi:hypothetical protein